MNRITLIGHTGHSAVSRATENGGMVTFSLTSRTAHDKQNACALITLNAELSQVAFNKGMEFMTISQDDITGEIALILRKENGIQMRLKGAQGSSRGNMVVANRPLVERLSRELKLPEGRTILKLSANKSVRDDVMFFLINQPNQ